MGSPVAEPQWFKAVYERSQVAVLIVDETGTLIGANPAACQLLGDGGTPGASVVEQLLAAPPDALTTRKLGHCHVQVHRVRYERADGARFQVIEVIDVTAQRRREQALLDRLDRDSLTGLKSRAGFMRAAARLGGERRRRHRPLAVAMVDLDNLKTENDTAGHAVGDAVLKLVAECCRLSLRDDDVLGRIGGDEFAAVLPGADLADALVIAERLRASVRARSGAPGVSGLRVSLSIGLALWQQEDNGIAPALERADKALYEAKTAGGDRVRQHVD